MTFPILTRSSQSPAIRPDSNRPRSLHTANDGVIFNHRAKIYLRKFMREVTSEAVEVAEAPTLNNSDNGSREPFRYDL